MTSVFASIDFTTPVVAWLVEWLVLAWDFGAGVVACSGAAAAWTAPAATISMPAARPVAIALRIFAPCSHDASMTGVICRHFTGGSCGRDDRDINFRSSYWSLVLGGWF